MTRWRISILLGLALVIGGPVLAPLLALAGEPQGWAAWAEVGRISLLARTTLLLATGTLALALPTGVALATLLYRTNLPGRDWLRGLFLLMLFVPLPLYAAAWQAALGTGGFIPNSLWMTGTSAGGTGSPWVTWPQGLLPAIWIHASAGLPWVVVIVGTALTWVERDLEEDALLLAHPWNVLRSVTLVRGSAGIAAAALWVGLQTATEMTITDALQVRTFAEEIYTQWVASDRAAVSRAVAVSLPVLGFIGLLVLWSIGRLERQVPPAADIGRPSLCYSLGRQRWTVCVLVVCLLVLLDGIPLVSLVWKVGASGWPEQWSAATAKAHLLVTARAQTSMLAQTVGVAIITGGLTAALALVLCWLAVGARWFQVVLAILLVAAWVWPGPLIGWGMLTSIHWLLDTTQSAWLARLLYSGPSPLPVMWAYLIRFLPFAVALLWPVVRLVPTELREAARLDGASPAQELLHLGLPLLKRPLITTALALAVLNLGELGASRLVSTPGAEPFAQHFFALMHYGVTNDLAALALLLLLATSLGALALLLSRPGESTCLPRTSRRGSL